LDANIQTVSGPAGPADAKRIGATYRMLRKRDPGALFVPAPPAAAGDQVFECGGGPCGVDTLRAYEAMIALHRAAILQGFRHSSQRRVVCEIATGNGEFAYQFKTLCGHVTYVICGPDALVSNQAALLRTALPDARFSTGDAAPFGRSKTGWADDDFILRPQSSGIEGLPDRIDLLVFGCSVDAWTTPTVDAYLAHAHAVECPFVYGVSASDTGAGGDSLTVRTILNRYYWLREFPILPGGQPSPAGEREQSRPSTHVIGWRRVRVA